MASREPAVITPRPKPEQEWRDQVAELIDEGLLTDDLESALYVVAGIIAADSTDVPPQRRHTELASRGAARARRTVVGHGSR